MRRSRRTPLRVESLESRIALSALAFDEPLDPPPPRDDPGALLPPVFVPAPVGSPPGMLPNPVLPPGTIPGPGNAPIVPPLKLPPGFIPIPIPGPSGPTLIPSPRLIVEPPLPFGGIII